MKRKCILKRLMSFLLVTILGIVPSMTAMGTLPVMAKTTTGLGSYADSESEVVGTWSYWDGSATVIKTNASLLEKLPDVGTPYRYTTDNYDANNGAFDTTNWATSFMWSVNGDNPYSQTVYAIPLAIRAGITYETSSAIKTANVIQVTAPSVIMDTAGNAYTMQMPAAGTMTDFFIKTSFETSAAKVDAVSDWGYDVHLEKSGDPNTYLELKMLQGSIFAYFELVNDNTLTIERGKSLPASVVYTSDAGNVIVVRCHDNADEDYDYYAFYGATGTTFNTTMNGSLISSIDVNFSSGTYFSLAYLGSSPTNPNDAWATNMCNAYLPYAYNFVTDTKAEYSYNETTSKVTTVYTYTVEKKPESTADGTIMGVLPHQYKNIQAGTTFLDYTYKTVRGTMKTIAGSSFTTELTYSGILPYMPDYTDDAMEQAKISAYLDDFTNNFSGNYFGNYEGSGDTYWDGKGLNRLANAMAAAEAAGDSRADSMFAALKSRLEEWFTYSGSSDTTYFYYDDGVGSLFGFPQSYDSVNQINDHHFHYGYFIYAAAQVAFRDKDWASDSKYGQVVKELIYDIACPDRNSASSKYPYLRSFAPYEGHSWASGHGNFDMGNNQESSSEALNAWAGIILWGEATGDTRLRDLGIYLYATEVSAVENYWYDVDKDVLADEYRYDVEKAGSVTAETQAKFTSAAIVWGGSYTYATWFSGNPLYIQGINLLPMNPTCFYLAGNKNYIKENYDLAYQYAASWIDTSTGSAWDSKSWFDIWCQYYAMAYPDEALAKWKATEESAESYGVEGGDTKAHTYHFIQTLCTYGTPDTSITSDTTLSSVFVKDDVKTYCAYNAGSTNKTVTFSDGYQIEVAPGTLAAVREGSGANQTTYKIQYYVENGSGSYTLHGEDTKYATIGNTVTLTNPKGIAGYEFDADNTNNVLSAVAAESGTTVLKAYYNRCTYTINYELNGGTQNPGNPDAYQYGDEIVLLEPIKSGYEFTGWYTNPALTSAITAINSTTSGNLILYAGWKDPYEYALDTYKKVTYEDGKLKVTVENVAASDNVLIYYNFYNSESEFSSVITDTGVAGLGGHNLTYDSASSSWIHEISSGFSTGQYFVFRINTLVSGVGELSTWGVYQIPSEDSSLITYYEDYYKEDLSGNYILAETVKKKAADGTNVICEEKTYTGFTYNSEHAENVNSAVLSGSSIRLKRYYSRNSYTISYNLNGGTNAATNPASYKYGSTISLTAPTKDGQEFGGWYTNEGLTQSFSGITASTTGNIELWAKWVSPGSVEAAYKIEHYKETAAGSGVYTLAEIEAGSAVTGTVITATAKTYTGYEENTTHEGRVPSGSVTADGSLVLKLYYDVVSSGSSERGSRGAAIEEGKIVAWFDDAPDGTGEIKFIAQVYDTESAARERMEDSSDAGMPAYMLDNDGDGTYSKTVDAISISDTQYLLYQFYVTPTPGFTGWVLTTKAELESSAGSSPVVPVNADYIVKHYQQNTTLDGYNEVEADRFNGNAQTGTSVSAEVKSYTGFTQNASAPLSNTSGFVIADGSLVLSVYYDRNHYNVIYNNMDGATNAATNAAEYVYGVGLSLADATKDDYDFGGWYTDEGFAESSKVTAIGTTQTGDVILYAKWTATQPENASYTVKYYQQNTSLDGYTEVEEDRVMKNASVGSVVAADVNVYTGFAQNTSQGVPSGTVLADGSLVLSVYYDRNHYNVTYNNMDGATNAATNAAEYVYGVGLSLADATKDGYSFGGWYTDAGLTESSKVTAISTTQTEDVVLYAKWIAVSEEKANYTVKHYQQNTSLDGYTEVEADRETKTANIGSNVAADIKDYTGFTYNADAEGNQVRGIVEEDGSLVLSVYYDRNKYQITYENMDGAENASENASEYVYGVGLTLKNPVKSGYTFGGWYTDAALTRSSKIKQISTTQTGDITVYAKWTLEATGDGDDYSSPEYNFTVDTIADQYYTGKKITPTVIVKDGNTVLTIKQDYTVKYVNNLKAGTAEVVITGKGNYSGTVRKSFEILPINIAGDDMSVDDIYVAYKNGKNIKVSPKLKWGTKTLKLNQDYVIEGNTSYGAVGAYTVTLKGINNFEGTRDILFEITDKTLMSKVKVAKIANQYYNKGEAVTPKVSVTYKGQPLSEGTDYTVEYTDNSSAGTATVILTGTGDEYVGIRKVTFKIIGTQLKTMPISLVSGEYQYTGEEIKPDYMAGSLKEGTDFTVSYSNNIKVGKGTVIFTGIGAYSGTIKKTFKITGYDIGTNEFDLFEDKTGDITVSYEKGGSKPEVRLKFAGDPVKEGVDYTIKYQNNNAVGTATLIVTGKGILKGTYTKNFTIEKANMEDVLLMASDVVYKAGKPASYYMSKVTVTDVNGKKLTAGKDYNKTVVYELVETGERFDKNSSVSNLTVGTKLRVTVTGLGCYDGTAPLEYTVVPASIKSAKVTILPQTYTGKPVTLSEDDITVMIDGQRVDSDKFEIVEGSYVNNVKKGTAKVTIHGLSEKGYGGYKTVSFKIGAKSVKDIIGNIFRFW